jgi:phi13 family phage major tail protein
MATVNEATDGTETFGTPKRLAKAISAKLDVSIADGTVYGDDGVAERVSEFSSAKLSLNVVDLAPEDVAALMGASHDATSKVTLYGKDDLPPYVAIGFRAKKSNGQFRYVWLYKGKFAPPNEEFQTKADKIEFKSPTIEGTFQTLNKNGLWKADITALPTDTIAAAWFTTVYEKTVTP